MDINAQNKLKNSFVENDFVVPSVFRNIVIIQDSKYTL